MRSLLATVTRDPLSLIGTAIATASAVLFVVLFGWEMVGAHGNPYAGILAYLVIPGIFLAGLALIPLGVARERRRARRAAERGEAAPAFPVIDLNQSRTRRLALTVLALTLVNVVILATAMYKGVEVMDSTEFCGATCHSVMAPEYTAYGRSPHSRVKCVECHIGPGAGWFVKSKLSGAWQVVAVTFDLYPRPIPTPIENLRPARETCEQCHWPTKFVGDRLKVITHYADDEASTELKTVLLLRVGGMVGRASHGIHWHVDPAVRIRYRADERRETIHEVEMTLADGTVRHYARQGGEADGEAGPEQPWRVMDCVDCHNRPTHIYRLPEREIDAAIQQGRIDRALPFVRREGLKALRQRFATQDEARRAIPEQLAAYYRENHPGISGSLGERVEEAGRVLAELYCANVFPAMNVDWGTYPDHIGHMSFPGCFRCHDEELASADGHAVSQDCGTCHTLLAMEEEDPEVLRTLQP